MARSRIFLATIACLLVSVSAAAAKFPASVEKTFTVRGDVARQWAAVLGLEPKGFQRVSLALHPMEAHARSLRSGGTAGGPAENEIVYDPAKGVLTLSGDWLDATTGSQKAVPRYNFSSGFVRNDLSGALGWYPLMKNLGLPKPAKGGKKNGDIVIKESSGSFFARTPPILEVRVYRLQSWAEKPEGEWGYQMMIGVEPSKP
ncbi:MAG TPA: hypothetical protein VFX30_06880 [bacterium]|nr:hypothetical protein [bacterium]